MFLLAIFFGGLTTFTVAKEASLRAAEGARDLQQQDGCGDNSLPYRGDRVSFRFPTTSARLTHGLCVSGASSATASHNGGAYTTVDPFGNGATVFVDQNYQSANVDATCEGGIYMVPPLLRLNSGFQATLTAESQGQGGPITMCAAISSGEEEGGWLTSLPDQGFEVTGTGFTYGTEQFQHQMVWYCKTFCSGDAATTLDDAATTLDDAAATLDDAAATLDDGAETSDCPDSCNEDFELSPATVGSLPEAGTGNRGMLFEVVAKAGDVVITNFKVGGSCNDRQYNVWRFNNHGSILENNIYGTTIWGSGTGGRGMGPHHNREDWTQVLDGATATCNRYGTCPGRDCGSAATTSTFSVRIPAGQRQAFYLYLGGNRNIGVSSSRSSSNNAMEEDSSIKLEQSAQLWGDSFDSGASWSNIPTSVEVIYLSGDDVCPTECAGN